MDKSDVKKFSLILWGGGIFSATNFQEPLFLASKYALGTNWIDPDVLKKSFPQLLSGGGGGLFCHKNQS